MDKRVGFWAGLTVIGFLIATKTQLINTLLAFFILGMIPGTSFTIPAWLIFTVYPIVFVGVLYWLVAQPLFIGEPVKLVKAATKPAKRKKPVASRSKQAAPKRRPRTAI